MPQRRSHPLLTALNFTANGRKDCFVSCCEENKTETSKGSDFCPTKCRQHKKVKKKNKKGKTQNNNKKTRYTNISVNSPINVFELFFFPCREIDPIKSMTKIRARVREQEQAWKRSSEKERNRQRGSIKWKEKEEWHKIPYTAQRSCAERLKPRASLHITECQVG